MHFWNSNFKDVYHPHQPWQKTFSVYTVFFAQTNCLWEHEMTGSISVKAWIQYDTHSKFRFFSRHSPFSLEFWNKTNIYLPFFFFLTCSYHIGSRIVKTQPSISNIAVFTHLKKTFKEQQSLKMKCSGGLCKEGTTTAGNYCIHNDFDAHVLWEVRKWAAFQVYSKAFCSDRKRSHIRMKLNWTNKQTKQTKEHLNTKAN